MEQKLKMKLLSIDSYYRFFFILFYALVLSVTVFAQSSESLPSATVTEIEKAITVYMSKQQVPGLSIAISRNNQILWKRGYGIADLENFVPAKDSTVYRLASVAKPITATAVMQLVEKKKIDLDSPIQKYVPFFPQKAYPVTVRDLLRHTSGVRHYKGGEFESTRFCSSLTEGINVFKDDPLEHKPGEKMTYSTYGYTLLGLAVESVSGMKFTDYLRRNIFEPAGMTHTRADSTREIIRNRAEGYTKTENGELRNADLADTSCKIPGGGLVSTVEDMARFAVSVQNGTLLKKETFEQMSTSKITRDIFERTLAPQKIPEDKELPGYGFGWITGTEKRKNAVWHGGVQQGVTTLIYLLPNEKIALVVMMNLEGEGDAIQKLGDQIAHILIQ